MIVTATDAEYPLPDISSLWYHVGVEVFCARPRFLDGAELAGTSGWVSSAASGMTESVLGQNLASRVMVSMHSHQEVAVRGNKAKKRLRRPGRPKLGLSVSARPLAHFVFLSFSCVIASLTFVSFLVVSLSRLVHLITFRTSNCNETVFKPMYPKYVCMLPVQDPCFFYLVYCIHKSRWSCSSFYDRVSFCSHSFPVERWVDDRSLKGKSWKQGSSLGAPGLPRWYESLAATVGVVLRLETAQLAA